jgi:hypothetical protein
VSRSSQSIKEQLVKHLRGSSSEESKELIVSQLSPSERSKNHCPPRLQKEKQNVFTSGGDDDSDPESVGDLSQEESVVVSGASGPYSKRL